ncbi:ring-opening amidohydrolase [Pigmentiphaga soli]|uniref:Cyanuric acid amidohydrolase n=1 Tax=Pigmentiphaga soli TaxID=1007095 RepID=A0ABP8HDZ5_9BURK
MPTVRQAFVHRFAASAPDDLDAMEAAVRRGELDPAGIVAVLGKTEGNGCVNDFTRGFASLALKQGIAAWSGRSVESVGRDVAIVMSGGTEGGLSPHWLVFEVREAPAGTPAAALPALAVGVAMTRPFAPEEIGRLPQIRATADAVAAAMRQAGIDSAADVHYVQVKCPLLTKARIEAAAARGRDVATGDTYLSMGYSRGASALGVALALGEVREGELGDGAVCARPDLYSGRASTSAGIELMENQVMVLGNSRAWAGELAIGHGVMQDPIDVDAVAQALEQVGLRAGLRLADADRARVAAVLAKAEPTCNGLIRGRRHVMLDDSDIHASRHARALVGGVLAGVFGDTQLFVSGGAEHQGPDGGGPVAVIARR